MRITRIDIRSFRRFGEVSLRPAPGVNMLVGANGAGKTTVLEALHLMAYGRSFRGKPSDGLIQQGSDALEVFVEWAGVDGRHRKVGMRHGGREWTGRLDGEDVTSLGELCAALAVITFEPGSHNLIMGGAEGRRRFLDWGLFHVEPMFIGYWRRYSRALKQRNALLKTGASLAQLDAWDHELVSAGAPLTAYRERYVAELKEPVLKAAGELAPELQLFDLEFSPGWRTDLGEFADALLIQRDRDRQSGFTSVGPHRADWELKFATGLTRDHLSRGQAKSSALAVLLGQAAHYAEHTGSWPVIALDDVASELDATHQQRVFDWLSGVDVQVFVTGTQVPQALSDRGEKVQLFHVEQGQIKA